jgi:hypothetical protein
MHSRRRAKTHTKICFPNWSTPRLFAFSKQKNKIDAVLTNRKRNSTASTSRLSVHQLYIRNSEGLNPISALSGRNLTYRESRSPPDAKAENRSPTCPAAAATITVRNAFQQRENSVRFKRTCHPSQKSFHRPARINKTLHICTFPSANYMEGRKASLTYGH